jgi:ornithine carbamoyltransferase
MLSLLAFSSSYAPSSFRASAPTRRSRAAIFASGTEEGAMRLAGGGRHFLHVNDLSPSELREVLELAKKIKPILKGDAGHSYKPFAGQTMSMIFTKPSTRTRVSFESGFFRLGGHALCLGEEIGIGKREATKDISRVVASMNELIMARLYAHSDILELARYSDVPVINGLTDFNHPCQIVADALTAEEVLPDGSLEGKRVVYVGDGNNIVNSWLELACILKFDFCCACPEGYEPDAGLMEAVAKSGMGTAEIVNDPIAAVAGADVVYADVWASMGQKEEALAREKIFAPYQVNEKLMAATGKDGTIFLHCLPAERGRETTDGVMESAQSEVFRQSENRMHAQNAIMVFCANAPRP